VIALTRGAQAGENGRYALAALIAVECAVFAVGVALALVSTQRQIPPAAEGLMLGAAAGALFGVSDIAIKYLTHAVQGGVLELVGPWTFAALAASVIAFYASARALQIGPAVEVIAITSVAANLTAIGGAILVFREPVGNGAVAITGRLIAFCLVVVGAALMPAPLRAVRQPAR
jgi:hypothetical protein